MKGSVLRVQYLSFVSDFNFAAVDADTDVDVMLLGYQRELTYQRGDGSFSAFGNSDPAGSIWSVLLYATY